VKAGSHRPLMIAINQILFLGAADIGVVRIG